MKAEYPQMLYKGNRETHIVAKDIDEHEKLAKEGWGTYDIVILGKNPLPEKKEIEEATKEVLGKAEVELVIPPKAKISLKKTRKKKAKK